MASRGLDIIVKVRDAASGELRNVQRSLDDTGKAVKRAGIDFTQFNKVMFSTTAFVNLFKKAFSDFGGAIVEGAELDRVQNQFENVLGPSGALFAAIRGMTGTAIDRVEAMRAGIAMKTLGIAGNMNDIAELIARSGDAAKMAGLDASEGVKKFTQFLKDGSFSSLEFLNLIRSSDPALKAQLSILKSVGGVFGSALTAQEKYNMGLSLLRAATRGMNKDNRDLLDVMIDLGQSFKFFKGAIGTFIGTAIKPLLDNIGALLDKWSLNIQEITKNDKNLKFLAKSVIVVSTALAGLVAVLGTLRLTVIALNSVGIGLPLLTKSVFGLALAFLGLTGGMENLSKESKEYLGVTGTFIDRIKLMGAFLRGIVQMVSTFAEAENFSKGVAKIDTALYNLLSEAGVLNIAIRIAKVISFFKALGETIIDDLGNVARFVDNKVGGIIKKIEGFFGLDTTSKIWARGWFTAGSQVNKTLSRVILTFTALLAISKLFKGFRNLLGGLPLVGRFFGGGRGMGSGQGPRGTKGDPIYVTEISTGLNMAAAMKAGSYFPTQIMKPLEAIKYAVGQLFRDFRYGGIKYGLTKGIPTLLGSIRAQTIRTAVGTLQMAKASRVGKIATTVLETAAPILRPIIRLGAPIARTAGRAVSAVRGFSFAGMIEAAGGLVPLLRLIGSRFLVVYIAFKALSGVVQSVSENFQAWKDLGTSVVSWLSSAFLLAKAKTEEFFNNLPDMLAGAWETIKSVGGDALGGIKSWAMNTFGGIYDTIADALSPIGDTIKGAFNWVDEMTGVGAVLATFKNALVDAVSGVYNAFKSLVGAIIDLIKKIPGVGDMITEGWKGIADLGATFAEQLAKNIQRSSVSMDLSTIQTTGKLAKLPDTEKERRDYLGTAMDLLQGVDESRVQDIARALRLGQGQLTPEAFAAALHAKMENSTQAQATKKIAHEVTKANNKPQMTNGAKRGC